MSQTLNVHVRVNDAATARPTPVRIRIAGLDGRTFSPLGFSPSFPVGRGEALGSSVILDGKRFDFIDGSCEVPLPTGVPLEVEITKGPRYVPIRETIALGEGQLTLRFAMRRWADSTWDQLIEADARSHFLTPHAARLEAEAEGLNLAHLLATVQDYPSTDGHLYRQTVNLEAFSGQEALWDRVAVSTFHVHPALGRLALLNCHRIVHPLTFGHVDEMDDWSLADWCGQCHRKKGLVVWCDAYRSDAGLPGGEALVEAILGRIDAIEIDAAERTASFLPHWYRLLNAGVRLPLVGSSAKASNRMVLGSMRTLSPAVDRTYAEWVETVRSGRTAASTGPLIRWSVNDEDFAVAVRESARATRFRAELGTMEAVDRFEVIANGAVIATSTSNSIEAETVLPDGGWLAARAWRPASGGKGSLFVHTSPTCIGPLRRESSACRVLGTQIEGVQRWIEEQGRFANPRRKAHLMELCIQARAELSSPS